MEEINLSGLRAGGNPQPSSTDGSCFGSGPRRTPLVVLEKLPEDIAGLVKELQSAVEEYERLVSETKTNIEKAEDARFAAEKMRAKAEELRIAAEELRASAEEGRIGKEAERVEAERLRNQAESLRVEAERLRASAEQGRSTAYTEAEAARNGLYQTAEAARNGLYQEAETARGTAYTTAEGLRDGAFEAKEATRDAANQAALNCAETLSALGPKIDQNKADIEALQDEVVEVGARAGSYDHIPLLGGQPMILFGSGAPVEANVPENWIGFNDGGFEWIGTPSMMGQQYIDTANGEKYVSIKNGFTLSWLKV